MYCIGDKIVYPLYGAGTILDLEDKHIDGAHYTYYVLEIPIGNLTIHLSTAKAADLNVRPIVQQPHIAGVLTKVAQTYVSMPDNWNLRYKENIGRIKSGLLEEVATVYQGLLVRERDRGLSTAEKKMMISTKQIILSELILSLDIQREEAETTLDDIFLPK